MWIDQHYSPYIIIYSVQVDVLFQSREREFHTIENLQTKTIEKSINHGSSSSVDPVTSFKVRMEVVCDQKI